jgi:integrase
MKNYQSTLRRFAAWLGQEDRGTLLCKDTEQGIRARRADISVWLGKRLTQASPVTVHGDYRALRAFYTWLVKKEKELRSNPMDGVDPPAIEETERSIATEADYQALLKACPNTVMGKRNAAILAMLWSGLRRGELSVLDVSDVDPIEGDITIRHTKMARFRKVTLMDDDMVLRLQRWLRVRPDDKGPALFVGTKGRLRPDGITDVFTRVKRAAGVSHVSPHSFRRGRTVAMLDDEMDGALIMAHMGWTSERMKARYARERTEELAKRAIKRKYRSKER